MRTTLQLLACIASVTAVGLNPRGVPFHVPDGEPDYRPDPSPEHPDGPGIVEPLPHPGLSGGVTAPEQVQFAPAEEPNGCLEEGSECSEMIEKGAELVSDLLDLLTNLISDSSSTSASTPTISVFQTTPAFTTGQSMPTLMPNYNVAAGVELSQEQLAVFNGEEQAMYLSDPLCFFANIERQYERAATAATSPTPTASAALRRQIISEIESLETASTSLTPLDSASIGPVQSQLFGSYFPDQIRSIYSPVANGTGTPMTTAVTTCSGLDGAASFTTPYAIKLEATPTASPNPPPSEGAVDGTFVLERGLLVAAVAIPCVVALM